MDKKTVLHMLPFVAIIGFLLYILMVPNYSGPAYQFTCDPGVCSYYCPCFIEPPIVCENYCEWPQTCVNLTERSWGNVSICGFVEEPFYFQNKGSYWILLILSIGFAFWRWKQLTKSSSQ